MKAAILTTFLFLFSCVILVSLAQETDATTAAEQARQRLDAKIAELQGLISKNGGCDAQLCFALQSSDGPGPAKFQLQKYFVVSAAEVFFKNQKDFKASALQFGLVSLGIALPNGTQTDFIEKVRDATFEPSDQVSLGAPIVACDAQLFGASSPNIHTVLFSNGVSDFGGDAAINAEIFQTRGGKIFGITFDDSQIKSMKEVVGPDVTSFEVLQDFWRIRYVLDTLVRTVCGIPN